MTDPKLPHPLAQVATLDPEPRRSEAVDPFQTVQPQSNSGSTGRFRVLRELNKGNLGVVYVAVDTELDREIALKHIREDRALSQMHREIFAREAEVTGKLEHPGIVPVYSLGKDVNDHMFYAMRLIRGMDLQTAINHFHHAVKSGVTAYDGPELRGLLRHLISVCHTIAYAHSRGVLHRDLKPANIMLGPYGETLVVDWGLAKVTGQASVQTVDNEAIAAQTAAWETPLETNAARTTETSDGTIIGTPVYAPLEQLTGEIDHIDQRSDIFSLGAILYQILTGSVTVQAGSLQELVATLQADRIEAPRERLATVPRPVSAICVKALKARREDRYQDVQTFRADIENWLNDQPVSAYAETRTERAYRWMRTHQTFVRGAIISMALVTLVSVVAAYFINYARNEQAAARKREAEARQQATELYQLARTTTESLLMTTSDRLKEIPDATDLRQELLVRAASAYKRMSESHSSDVGLQRESASALMGLAAVQRKLALSLEASQSLEQAVRIWESLVGLPDAIDSDSAQLIKALIELSRVSSDVAGSSSETASASNSADRSTDDASGRVAEAPTTKPTSPKSAEQSLQVCVRALTLLDRFTNRAGCPPEFWLLRGEALIQKALMEQDRQNTLASIDANRAAIDALKRGGETVVDTKLAIDLRHQLARGFLNLAYSLERRDPADRSIQSAEEEALANLQWCMERAPTNSAILQDLAVAHGNLADSTLHKQRDLDAAQRFYQNSSDFFSQLSQHHPLVSEYKNGLVLSLIGRGNVAWKRSEGEQAQEFYRQANTTAKQLLLQNSMRTTYRTTAASARFALAEVLTYSEPAEAFDLLIDAQKLLPSLNEQVTTVAETLSEQDLLNQLELVRVQFAFEQLELDEVEGLEERLPAFIEATASLTSWSALYNSACYLSLACDKLAATRPEAPAITASTEHAIQRIQQVVKENPGEWDRILQEKDLAFVRAARPQAFQR